MKFNVVVCCVVYFVFSIPGYAGNVISEIPENPDTSTKYIFYVHGSVEETEGSTEKYESAVQAIAESTATVISEIRGKTEPNVYAEKLKRQVNSLITQGVPAENITISGYSKGAIISLATAGTIQRADINYVLLAGCSQSLNDKYRVDPIKSAGRILSIFDSGDDKYGSCSGIVSKSEKVKFKEIKLNTGKGHSLFRIPKEKFIEIWRDPLVDWAGA